MHARWGDALLLAPALELFFWTEARRMFPAPSNAGNMETSRLVQYARGSICGVVAAVVVVVVVMTRYI